jgi:anaerobic ribonucleoside-triphosphate reductase
MSDKNIEKISNKQRKIPNEVYDRVSGYLRPVSQFNKGKQEEQKQRKRYKVPDTLGDMK